MSRPVLTPDMEYIVKVLEKIIHIPSPSGFTGKVMEAVKEEAESFGFQAEYSAKGGLIITVSAGEESEKKRGTLGISAHVDTLGGMVRSITSSGMIKFVPVGGFMMESIEGMYCKIHTRKGQTYTGTVLTAEPSVHTYDDARTLERKVKNMEIRLDEQVKTSEDAAALGIRPGDYISFDPMFTFTDSGFIKSRHLDDKASVAVLLGFLRYLKESGKRTDRTIKLCISNYEEVGHGASWIPEDIVEFLAVDMGALGDDLSGDEYKVSICAMDSSGPYDYEMTSRLIAIAEEKKINFAVDIFPHYGSDGTAALRGGNNIRCALIGQGVHASHGTERTHVKGLEQTFELLKGFVGV